MELSALELVLGGAVALVVYGYAGYPLLLLALDRLRSRPVLAAPITPIVSVIVTVHNGEALIEAKLANCLALDYPVDRLEILVASDGSTDRTNELVRASVDPRVVLVAVPARRGKEVAQQAAIARARGEILVFTDGGVRVAPGALRILVASFADPSIGCVSGVDRVVNRDGQAVGEGAFVRYETWLKRLESRIGSTVGNSGWFFAVRASLCDCWPDGMASDFTMLLRTVQRGHRGIVEPRAVAAAEATPAASREFQRKVRTMVRGMVVVAAHRTMLNPARHGFFAVQLMSHKIFRWILPGLLLLILLCSLLLAPKASVYTGLAMIQVLFYGLGLLWPAARIPHFFVTSSAAVMVAWWKFLSGERFVAWDPTPRAGGA